MFAFSARLVCDPPSLYSCMQVTSPQAFEGLRTAGRAVRRPDCTLATADHNVQRKTLLQRALALTLFLFFSF